ncbi:MAG: rhomboid family intramembrane serine protease [Actinomycetota bacterium]
MTQASVGFHCPECVRGNAQQVYRGPVVFDPIATKVLLGVTVAVSLLALGASGSLGGLSVAVLTDWSLFGPFVARGDNFRLVTSGFLHSGLLHLGLNMAALWLLGQQLERAMGRVRFVSLYAVSLLGGSFGALLIEPRAATVGASGAIYGLFGAIAVMQRSQGTSIWESGIGPLLGINLLVTFAVPQISIGGHLGGLVTGALLTVVFVQMVRMKTNEWLALIPAVLLAALLVLAAVSVAANPVL